MLISPPKRITTTILLGDGASLLKSQTMLQSQDKEAPIKIIAKTTIVTETEIGAVTAEVIMTKTVAETAEWIAA